MTEQDKNKELIRQINAAILAGRFEELEDHPAYWQTREIVPRMLKGFPDIRGEVVRQLAEGDLVATHLQMTGTHTAEFMGFQPTGRQASWQNVSIDRVVDGKVVEHNGESGWIAVLAQLGLLPQPR